jgi:hypothetical protein
MRPSCGPLFDPPVEHLVGRTDPQTSRAAAESVKDGIQETDQYYTLCLIRLHPGKTAKELGEIAAAADDSLADVAWASAPEGKGPEYWRQRIGRRLNELTNPPDSPGHVPGKPHLIERRGTRDGCSLWWPVGYQAPEQEG